MRYSALLYTCNMKRFIHIILFTFCLAAPLSSVLAQKLPVGKHAAKNSDDWTMYIIGAVIALGVVLVISKSKKKGQDVEEEIRTHAYDPNLIQDKDVNVKQVIEHIREVKPQIVKGRKDGFTEKDIEKQMYMHLKAKYQTVTTQYGIDGGKFIDFDLGRNKVGVELKIGQKCIKSAEADRLKGQIMSYVKKYSSSNLIVVVAGFDEEYDATSIQDISIFLQQQNSHFIFLKAGSREKMLS